MLPKNDPVLFPNKDPDFSFYDFISEFTAEPMLKGVFGAGVMPIPGNINLGAWSLDGGLTLLELPNSPPYFL